VVALVIILILIFVDVQEIIVNFFVIFVSIELIEVFNEIIISVNLLLLRHNISRLSVLVIFLVKQVLNLQSCWLLRSIVVFSGCSDHCSEPFC